jgi:hypothetical protein
MATKKIKINRAPVLTLWAAVVAERLGYDKNEALTLGKAVAGLNAQSKGRRLGIYEEKKDEPKETKKESHIKLDFVELLGRGISVIKTSKGLRAAIKGEEITPQSVEKYLRQQKHIHPSNLNRKPITYMKSFAQKSRAVRKAGAQKVNWI